MDKSLSFPDAIAYTQDLMQQMLENRLSESEIEKAIANLVSTQAGARGFFVAYLTGELPLADNPTPEVIKALKSSPDVVSDLLVKNVAMSAAMKMTHLRNNDETAASGSERVNRRTINLIEQLKMAEVEKEVRELQSTIIKGEGSYQKFLTRWGYDREQRAKIAETVSEIDL